MHSWEEALVKQVAKRRGEEADHLARFQYLQAVSVSVNMAWPVVALVANLLTYGWVHDAPPPLADLFAVLALFKMIQSPFRAFSDGLASVAQASVSINRMRDIILKPMLAPQERSPAAKAGDVAVSCEGVFRWDPDGRALLRLPRQHRLPHRHRHRHRCPVLTFPPHSLRLGLSVSSSRNCLEEVLELSVSTQAPRQQSTPSCGKA